MGMLVASKHAHFHFVSFLIQKGRSMFKYIRQHQQVGILFAVALIITAVVITWMTLMPSGPKKVTRGFFTVDEGKTWFIDDVQRITPFDKDGKPAVRGYLFKCPGGKVYCGLLSRHTDSARKKADEFKSQNPDKPIPDDLLVKGSRDFRQPAKKQWVNDTSNEIFQVTTQKSCPDGSYPEPSMP